MSEAILRTPTSDSLWQRFRDALPPGMLCALVILVGVLIPVLLLYFPMMLIIGGVVGILGVSLILASPYVGLILFLTLLYLRPEELFPVLAGARLTLSVSVLALVAWSINTLLCKEQFLFHLPAVRCFLGFVLVAVGSTALSGSGTLTDTAQDMLRLFILYVLILHLINTPSRLRMATGTIVLFSAVMGARAIWQFLHGDALIEGGEENMRALATGIFNDPNDLALGLAMALPLALGSSFEPGGWLRRLWNLAAVPIFVWTIFLTNSRGGMLALMTALCLFFSRRLGRIGMVLGAVAILGIFAFGPSRMSQMNADEDSAAGRVDAWEAGLDMVKSSPIWGIGQGQFTEHHNLTAHNSLVLCLAELGLAGTALWIGLFFFAFRDGRLVAACRRGARQQPARRDGRLLVDGRTRVDDRGVTRQPREILKPSPDDRTVSSTLKIPRSQSDLLQISLATFMVGGFFLSRTYTVPLYVFLSLTIAATRIDAQALDLELPPARRQDCLRIVGLTVAGLILVHVLVQLWG